MESTLAISFALSPGRIGKAITSRIKASGYPLPYAECQLIEHNEAELYCQQFTGWQFNLHIYTAIMKQGQPLQLQLATGQALFAYQLSGRINQLLNGGEPFHLEAGYYGGCYLPAGTYQFHLPPGTHETMLITFPYGYLVWLTKVQNELHPIIHAWKTNVRDALYLRKVSILQDERRTIERILSCPKRGNELDGALKVYLARLLTLYHERLQEQPTGRSLDNLAQQAQAFIEEHYAEKFPLNPRTINQQFGCSSATLRNAYRAEHGISVATAVRRQRIHAAKHLLLETDLPLTAIAEQVGFAHAESLIRTFKREEGLTPAVFREQN